jgi:hypothetical protein
MIIPTARLQVIQYICLLKTIAPQRTYPDKGQYCIYTTPMEDLNAEGKMKLEKESRGHRKKSSSKQPPQTLPHWPRTGTGMAPVRLGAHANRVWMRRSTSKASQRQPPWATHCTSAPEAAGSHPYSLPRQPPPFPNRSNAADIARGRGDPCCRKWMKRTGRYRT